MRILVVGYSTLDVTCVTRGRPAPDSKHEVEAILLGGGGPGATAAVALARLGAQVRLVTVLGDDIGAEVQRRELAQAGVEVVLPMACRGHATGRAVIMVDPQAEQRTIYWTRGDLPQLDPAAMDPGWLDDRDLVLCDGHDSGAAAVLAREARRRGLPVVLDAGSVRSGAAALVAACTDVISSAVFAPTLTGEADPEAALRALRDRGPERVAITFGERGCLALVDDAVMHVPAFAVPVKDTTGAGDAFHAGYAYARAAGRDWPGALEFAAATAALKCRDWGGRRGLPTLLEVEALVREGCRR